MSKLSFTALSTFEECGHKYALKYIDKTKPKKHKSAFAFGRALDEAQNVLLLTRDLELAKKEFLKHWLKQKINGKEENLYKSDVVHYTKNDLDRDLVSHLKITDERKLAWSSLSRKGYIMLEAYNKKIMPLIAEVVSVQDTVMLYNADGDQVTGKIDLIVKLNIDKYKGKTFLIDNKSTSVKYDIRTLQESTQLATYKYIVSQKIPIDGVGYFVVSKNINKNKKKTCKTCSFDGSGTNHKTCNNLVNKKRCNGEWTIEIFPTADAYYVLGNVSDGLINETFDKYDAANVGIAEKKFDKNYDSCIGKFGRCEYFELCHMNLRDGYVFEKDDSDPGDSSGGNASGS